MRLLLTDEEICRALCGDEFVDKFKPLGCMGCSPSLHYDLPKAQLKKVGEWGKGNCCDHAFRDGITQLQRRECPECWKALLEEVK